MSQGGNGPYPNDPLFTIREALRLSRELVESDFKRVEEQIAELKSRVDELEGTVYKRPDSLTVGLARNNQRDDTQDRLHQAYKERMDKDADDKPKVPTNIFDLIPWTWEKAKERGSWRGLLVIGLLCWAVFFDGCNVLIKTVGDVLGGKDPGGYESPHGPPYDRPQAPGRPGYGPPSGTMEDGVSVPRDPRGDAVLDEFGEPLYE